MIRHLRLRLTAFNTAVTGAILIAMAALCLFLSERDARDQAFRSFSGGLDTVATYLSGQDRLSATWLRQMERSSGMTLYLRDAQVPLYSMGLSQGPDRQDLARIRALAAQAGLDIATARTGGSLAFPFAGADGGEYLAGVALVEKEGALLELTALYSLEDLQRRVLAQRLAVGLGAGVALVLLAAFSWVFIGRVLDPVARSRRRQAQFIAAASHELRTPLAAILSAASAAGEGPFLPIIVREGQRMAGLIEDLLCLTAADSGSWALDPQPTELDMLVLEAFETYQPQARERGLRLRVALPEEPGPQVRLDRARIAQVLAILLDNALSYTPAPGEVRLELRWTRTRARISVSDTGPGVPKDQREAIFQRFHRGGRDRTDRAHFGLGLSIASEIARAHHARLWTEPNPEGGATFILDLPLEAGGEPGGRRDRR